jgi:uracil-DNA glycosylase family 4
MNAAQAEEMLREIAAEIRGCTRCALCRGRTVAVPGEGPPDADIMFVGEGPGFQEDQQGRPFVGPAGALLSELLQQAGLRRERVFITNLVKCRPPGNREPTPEEVVACRDYLNAQIALINPGVLCTLGRPALQTLVNPQASISREHGVQRHVDGILFVPLYHPAAALHRQDLRPALVEDMRKLKLILERRHLTSPQDMDR